MRAITLPKHFANFLSGSDVVIVKDHGEGDYPAGPAIAAAWADRFYYANGAMVLSFNEDDFPDALDCLDEYAETCAVSAADARTGYRSTDQEYREYSAELAAARHMRRTIANFRVWR